MELDTKRIEDGIISEVADRLVDEEDLTSRVKAAIDARINAHFREIADAQIKVAIETAIKDGFEREYRRVSAWGEPQGEKTSIRKELENLVGGYWNTMVDKNGKPDNSSYGSKLTRAEWLMTQLVASDFQGEMKQHVVNVGGVLKDKLRAELHGTVNKLLSEVFHVRSVDDQSGAHYGHHTNKQTGTA